MRQLWPAMLCAALLLPLQGFAKAAQHEPARDYSKVDHWDISSSDGVCLMMAVTLDNEMIAVRHDAQAGNAQIMFSNPNATSLADGEKKQLKIIFLNDDDLDDGWGVQEFTVGIFSDGSRALVSEGLDGKQLMDDVARGSHVGFYFGDKLISAFVLKSTAKAIPQLRECALKAAGLNPKDPFLE